MTDQNKTSGEINVLILARITEVASKLESVANVQNDLKTSMTVQFNDGKHRMNGLETRIEGLEKNGCQRLVQHQQAVNAAKNDDDSDWSKPAKHRQRNEREVKPEPISKKMDMGMWIKIGWIIGAAVAGAFAAQKAGIAP